MLNVASPLTNLSPTLLRFSKIAGYIPFFSNTIAQDNPDIPAPIIATSTPNTS